MGQILAAGSSEVTLNQSARGEEPVSFEERVLQGDDAQKHRWDISFTPS